MSEETTTPPDQEEQSKRFDEFHVGDTIHGETIKKVFYATGQYIIYQVEGRDNLLYDTGNNESDLEIIYECMIKFSRKLVRPIDKQRFRHKLATTIHIALKGKKQLAEKMCKEIVEEIDEYTKILRNGRVTYLLTVTIATILIWSGTLSTELVFPIGDTLTEERGFLGAALFSLTGGFFSIVIGLYQIDFYFEKRILVFVLTSVSRIMISIFSGVVLYVMIKSNLALGFLADTESSNPYVILVFATLAGFSESFIPNVLNNIQKNSEK